MGLVDESLMSELPNGVLGLHDVGYTITSLHKNNDEIVCNMDYGIRETYEWTVYDDGSFFLRLHFTGVTNRETTLVEYLTKKNVDMETAKRYYEVVKVRHYKLFDTLFELTGSHLSNESSVDEIRDLWKIRIVRDVTDVTLGYLADAIYEYVRSNERWLERM